MTIHKYEVKIQWEGNTGTGTSSYRSYKRDFSIQHPQKVTIQGSSDPAYLGDMTMESRRFVGCISFCLS